MSLADRFQMKTNYTRRAALKMGSGGGFLALLTDFGRKPMAHGSTLRAPKVFRDITRDIERTDPDGFDKIMRAYHANRQYCNEGDLNTIDMDISCLRSVSPAAKLIMQRRRSEQYSDWVSDLRKFFGKEGSHSHYDYY